MPNDPVPHPTPAEPRGLHGLLPRDEKEDTTGTFHGIARAEPRIETVPMKDAAKEWNMESEQFGAQPEPEERVDLVSDAFLEAAIAQWHTMKDDPYYPASPEDLAMLLELRSWRRARAGSSLSQSPQWPPDGHKTTCSWVRTAGGLCDCGWIDEIKRRQSERASPPSSPRRSPACRVMGSRAGFLCFR